MKKIIVSAFTALAVFSFFIVSPSLAEARSVTFSYSTFFPPTHIQAITAEAWCKEVEKRTEGRVKVDFYPGQTLTRAPETIESLTSGIVDIGTSALAYTQGRFPVMATMDLPLGYPSGVAATEAANKLFDKYQPKEFDGVKVMYFNAHGPGFIHTRDKPATTLEDLRGLRIRSTGMSANVVRALGATPVSMAMPDTYQSLQRGVVDGSIHPIEVNEGWNMGEVVDYCTIAYPSAYTTTFWVAMNKSKWNTLSAEDQRIIEEINEEWAHRHGEAWDSSDKDGREFFLAEGGEIVEIDDAEAERWAEAVAPVVDEYVEMLNKETDIDGREAVEFIREILDRHRE